MSFILPSPSSEQLDLLEMLRSGDDSRQRRLRGGGAHRNHVPTPKAPPVVLFCGADLPVLDSGCKWDEQRRWSIQVVPEDAEEAPAPPRKRQRYSSGCGARIHASADADKRWTGLPEGVNKDRVVPLDEEYFSADAKRELKLGNERCGCTRTGRGCAVCGNPLGAFFKPCERHVSFLSVTMPHYIFLHNAVSPPLPNPPRRLTPAPDAGDASQRRARDREELQRLRARIRERSQNLVQQAQARTASPAAPTPPTEDAPPRVNLSHLFTWRDRLSPPLPTAPSSGASSPAPAPAPVPAPATISTHTTPFAPGNAFESWADETMERATAIAASDIPIFDFDFPSPIPADSAPRADTPDWWSGVVAQPTRRRIGRMVDWPPPVRSYERSTAVPATEDVPEDEQEGDKEEPARPRLFER